MHCSICRRCPPTVGDTLSRRHNGRRVKLVTQLHVVRSSSRIKLMMSDKGFRVNGATASQVCVSAMFVITDCMKVKIKIVKFTTEKAMKVRDAVEVWLYSFSSPGTRWGGWSTLHASRFTPGKDTRHQLYRWRGGHHSRSERVGKYCRSHKIK
jgi:hypothetical protein